MSPLSSPFPKKVLYKDGSFQNKHKVNIPTLDMSRPLEI